MEETVGPVSTCGRELLRGWWRPTGLMVSFMIFTASVRNILDTPSYTVCSQNCAHVGFYAASARNRHSALHKVPKQCKSHFRDGSPKSRVCVFWSINLSEACVILTRIRRDIIKNIQTLSCKVAVILCQVLMKLAFSGVFSKNSQTSNFMKLLFHADRLTGRQADGRTDGRTNIMKLIVACRNFANALKNGRRERSIQSSLCLQVRMKLTTKRPITRNKFNIISKIS
jgi:hypothetical protein